MLQKSRLIFPEINVHQQNMNKLKQANELKLANLENQKIKEIKEKYGLGFNLPKVIFSFSQIGIMAAWAGLVQRFSYHVEDYPEMLTGGFFWFKDLSVTDQYFLLPSINCLVMILLTYNNTGMYANPLFLRLRRFMYAIPLFSLPIMCTLENGFVLYVLVSTSLQHILNYLLSTKKAREILEIPQFLPGTKLESLVKIKF
jgi:hypothetical protein